MAVGMPEVGIVAPVGFEQCSEVLDLRGIERLPRSTNPVRANVSRTFIVTIVGRRGAACRRPFRLDGRQSSSSGIARKSALTARLEQQHPERHRDIEALCRPGHGNAHEVVAALAGQPTQPLASPPTRIAQDPR